MKGISVRLKRKQIEKLQPLNTTLTRLGYGSLTIGQVVFYQDGSAELVIGAVPPGNAPRAIRAIMDAYAVELNPRTQENDPQ